MQLIILTNFDLVYILSDQAKILPFLINLRTGIMKRKIKSCFILKKQTNDSPVFD